MAEVNGEACNCFEPTVGSLFGVSVSIGWKMIENNCHVNRICVLYVNHFIKNTARCKTTINVEYVRCN